MEERQFAEIKIILEHIEALLEFLCARAIDVMNQSDRPWIPYDQDYVDARKIPKKGEQ